MDVLKVINTVRYMTLRQWKYRLYYIARNKVKKRTPKSATYKTEFVLLPTYYASDIEDADITGAEGILENKISTVAGKKITFDGDWDLKGEKYRLVCFKLNSFRWLLELSDAYKITGDRRYIDKGFELIQDWQTQCGNQISGDKWNAYVIAERITNWIGFCSEYASDNIKYYADLIFPQAQELKNSIEYQLGANHLLSEAKALVYAGAFFGDADLYMLGKALLISESKEQFYPDGGHYEQSVSYHVESLQQYFESYAVMKMLDDSDADKFTEIMKEPYRFLNGMIGVNGKIPLFNDSAYDYPFFDAADFLSTASYIYSIAPPNGRDGTYHNRWNFLETGDKDVKWENKIKYENTGFIHYKFEKSNKKYSFFMDCGNNGPDYNLGHTHADALSILLYSDDKEVLVDSGVFTYQPGLDRDFCRSTKAHNTVEIDGQNSAEIWSAFRVARRGYTKILDFSVDNGLRIKAFHDGYAKILKSPVNHIREVIVRDGRIEIVDVLDSRGEHNAISRFHVCPECRVEMIDSCTCRINGNITVKSDKHIILKECVVATLFGIVKKATCLEIAFQDKNYIIFDIG